MGKHLEEAQRFRALKEALERKVKEANQRGWKISAENIVGIEEFGAFLDKLIASEEVVDTGEVAIFADRRSHIGLGGIYIDHRAHIDDIISFLKE